LIRGTGTLQQDIQQSEQPPKAGPIIGLIPNISSELGKRQLAETARALPVLVLFHICAVIAITSAVGTDVPAELLRIWQLGALVAASIFLGILYAWQPHVEKPRRTANLLRIMPCAGVFLALVWAVPPLMFMQFTTLDTNILIHGVLFTMVGVGVISLLRAPATAIMYTSFLTVAISQSLYAGLGSHQMIAAAICLLFGLALVGIIIVVHLDFTRRTQIELDANRQSQIIKLLLNDFERDTSDWLWETGRAGELTYFSPRLASILDKAPEHMRGQEFFGLINCKADSPELLALRAMMAMQSEILNHVLEFENDGQTQFWELTARPLLDEKGEFSGYRGVGRDVTRQHDAELQIRNAKEFAERASAAKSQFLAVISHELRTPINAIVGFSEVLNTSYSENLPAANRKDYLNTILESAQHLQGLINDILDATRIERGTLQIVDQENDAAELLEAAIKICRDQATKANISIVAHVSEDVSLMGDMTRLMQVILNLMTNAIKFSPAGGVVNVDMQCGDERELIISIRDAGIGIGVEDAERMFEPFVQADEGSTRRFGGVGLGLSIARRIARLHGGDVTLNGEPGVGTDARMIIPAARVRWPKTPTKPKAMVAA
jgi:signal transduction histidine kinase